MLDDDELMYTRILNHNATPDEITDYIDKLHKKIKELKKYDVRKFIKEENRIHSPSFTKEEVDLMNVGIALKGMFDKLFNDESNEGNDEDDIK